MKLRFPAALALPLLSLAFSYSASAQQNATVVVKFIGESDRFVLPAIVGTSRADAERTRDELFAGSFSSASPVFVVAPATMDQLLNSPFMRGLADAKTHNGSTGLRVEIVSGDRHINQVVPLSQAQPLLAELRQLSSNPAFEASLAEIQQRTQDTAQSQRAFFQPAKAFFLKSSAR